MMQYGGKEYVLCSSYLTEVLLSLWLHNFVKTKQKKLQITDIIASLPVKQKHGSQGEGTKKFKIKEAISIL